jgi:hypothetical protein
MLKPLLLVGVAAFPFLWNLWTLYDEIWFCVGLYAKIHRFVAENANQTVVIFQKMLLLQRFGIAVTQNVYLAF